MRALALFSGGLDSMLAIKLITEQDVDVTALFIDVGFGSTKDRFKVLKERALMVGANFEVIETREQFVKEILFSPKYGYGKNFNPCIDCHANMFRIALGLLDRYEASFVITGEVVGQRPMSQRLEAIKNVTKLAGDESGLILRPLSAKLMEPTYPEIKGWVDREKLLGVEGRSRVIQLSLAAKYGFTEYESPGGGCLLTEATMAKKIRDIVNHGDFKVEDIDLLKFGRHFRLPDGAKLVMGRNKDDNEELKKINHSDYVRVTTDGIPCGVTYLSKDASIADRELAAKLLITYTKAPKDRNSKVFIDGEEYLTKPFSDKKEASKFFVVK
jgi:tRNA-specific 2-thiouridylase